MKTLYITVLAMMMSCGLYAQDIKTEFVSMPDSVAPILTKINREDCVDFLDSKMKAVVRNRLGRVSELKTLTKDYLFMQTSPVSNFQMKLLPVNDSVNVICMVDTYCAEACDSKISFYDSKWNPLKNEDFITFSSPKSQLNSFIANVEDSVIEASKLLNFSFKKLSLSPDNTSLTLSYSSIDNLNETDKKRFQPLFNSIAATYEWNDGKFLKKQ